jgi:methionyl-tRNA synthetase
LAAITGFLGADGFALSKGVAELNGVVTDVREFAEREHAVSGIDRWRDETRTAIALELAAARLVATCAAPIMPGFAGKLADRLGLRTPTEWPRLVELVPAGSAVDLADAEFFHQPRLRHVTTEEDNVR